MAKMSRALMEAYIGTYEDDMPLQVRNSLADRDAWIEAKILSHDAKQRLRVYLSWQGIVGYTETIYMIATGAVE